MTYHSSCETHSHHCSQNPYHLIPEEEIWPSCDCLMNTLMSSVACISTSYREHGPFFHNSFSVLSFSWCSFCYVTFPGETWTNVNSEMSMPDRKPKHDHTKVWFVNQWIHCSYLKEYVNGITCRSTDNKGSCITKKHNPELVVTHECCIHGALWITNSTCW